MKFFKKRVLVLSVLLVIACLSNPVVCLSESGQKRVAYYNTKDCFLYLPFFTMRNSVLWRENTNSQNQTVIEIAGQVSRGIEISIRLSYDEKTGREDSRLVIIEGKRRTEIEFRGIMTGIQYLRSYALEIGEEKKMDVLTEKEVLKETLSLFLKVKDERSMTVGNIACPVVYITEVRVEDGNGDFLTKVELWFIKGGPLDGYIAKFKMPLWLDIMWLELTLSKVQ